MAASIRIVPRPADPTLAVWRRLARDGWHVIAVALLFGVLALAAIELTRESGRVASVWLGNGFLLAVLLTRPTARWRDYLLAAGVTNVTANLVAGDGIPTALAVAAINLLEVGLAGAALRGRVASLADLSRASAALHYTVFALVLAPLVASALASAWVYGVHGEPYLAALATWYSADALGMAIVAPLVLAALAAGDERRRTGLLARWPLLLLVLACVTMFGQERFPYLFWIFPPLLFVVLRGGLRGAVQGVAVVALIGLASTLSGHGPLTAIAPDLREQVLMLQIFIACALLVCIPTALTLAERDRLERTLRASQERYRFLTEHSRDVVVRGTIDGYPLYVSPSVTELLGWTPDECLARPLIDLVHPDDNHLAMATFAAFAAGSDGDSNVYRVRRRDGGFVWIETSSRVLRDAHTGEPTEFVSTIRDIDERMRASQEMERNNARLQELAMIDALTGLGNRRAFDEAVLREWRRAARDHAPVSLLLIDVDHFKRYNDHHGHAQGDNCLRAVAEVIRGTVGRAEDVVTRYGGEEFAVILPNTTRGTALQMAERVRAAIQARAIAHERSPYNVVTACVGVACATPGSADVFPSLFHQADTALYRGKSTGRNKVHAAGPEAEAPLRRVGGARG